MTFTAKKLDYIFEGPLTSPLAFLLFRCRFQEKIEPAKTNYFQQHTEMASTIRADTENGLIFLSVIAIIQEVF